MGIVRSAARVAVLPLIGSAALTLILLAVAHGQVRTTSLRATSLSGEVSAEDRVQKTGLTVELSALDAQSAVVRTHASTLGGFSIDGIEPVDYRLCVTDQFGNALSEERVWMTEFPEYMKIRLPGVSAERPAAGTISASRLAHMVPKQVQKEFRKAEKATKTGDERSAIANLNKALQIDPEYMEASNIAAARLALRRQYPQAEEAARSPLRCDPGLLRARLLLGAALAAQRRQDDAALENLQATAEKFPRARLVMAEILMRQGGDERAAAALREYLASKDTEGRDQARMLLAEFQQHAVAAATENSGP